MKQAPTTRRSPFAYQTLTVIAIPSPDVILSPSLFVILSEAKDLKTTEGSRTSQGKLRVAMTCK